MSEKKSAAPAAVAAPETPAAEPKKRKSSGAAQRRGRPPLSPEVYVEFGTNQYNITDVIERAKADYRATHKVGVQSCKVYVKPKRVWPTMSSTKSPASWSCDVPQHEQRRLHSHLCRRLFFFISCTARCTFG